MRERAVPNRRRVRWVLSLPLLALSQGHGLGARANLFSSTAKLTWIAGGDTVKTFKVPGTRHQRSFCPNCGSGLPGLHTERALLVVPAGSLDTPFERRPDAHLFVASRAAWDSHLETVPTFDGLPT